MVAVAQSKHLVRAPVRGRQQQRRLVRLGSRRREEDLAIVNRGELGDALGELDGRLDQIKGRGVQHLVSLALDCVDDLGDGMARHRRQDAGKEVEITIPFGIPDVPAFAALERDGLLVVQG